MQDLTTIETRLALVAKYAPKYGLDPTIVAAVCEQESSWNTWSIRFEPGFLARYVAPLGLLDVTEAQARATSFGLMQVMGQVARELHFPFRFLTQLCDPDVGIDVGCQKLKQCFDDHDGTESSLLAYNGGGNQFYAKQVLARVPHYTHDAHDAQGVD